MTSHSPYSESIEQYLSTLGSKLDITPSASVVQASSSDTGSPTKMNMMMERLNTVFEKYGNQMIGIYIIGSLIGAYLFANQRASKAVIGKDEKHEEASKLSVLLWFLVFSSPVIVLKYVTR